MDKNANNKYQVGRLDKYVQNSHQMSLPYINLYDQKHEANRFTKTFQPIRMQNI